MTVLPLRPLAWRQVSNLSTNGIPDAESTRGSIRRQVGNLSPRPKRNRLLAIRTDSPGNRTRWGVPTGPRRVSPSQRLSSWPCRPPAIFHPPRVPPIPETSAIKATTENKPVLHIDVSRNGTWTTSNPLIIYTPAVRHHSIFDAPLRPLAWRQVSNLSTNGIPDAESTRGSIRRQVGNLSPRRIRLPLTPKLRPPLSPG